MNNKFENEKSQRKNPNGPLWHDRTLHTDFIRTLDWMDHSPFLCLSSIYQKSSIRLCTVCLYCLLIKQGWRNISSFFLPKKKKNIRVRIKPVFIWNFETYLQRQTLNFDRLFLSNHSWTNSCVCPLRSAAIMQTAQEMTRTSQNQREGAFD